MPTKSDLLLYELHGPLSKGVSTFVESLKFIIELQVNSIVPGEPIRARWRFNTASPVPESANVRFLIEKHVILERNSVPCTEALEGTGWQNETIAISDPEIAKLAYRFGPKYLELEARGNGQDTKISRRTVSFRVKRESVDPSWWEWRVLEWDMVPWKVGYALVANFANKFRFSAVRSVSAEISEVRSEENPNINPCEFLPVQIQSHNDRIEHGIRWPFMFSFLQDWHWLMSTTYFVEGPLEKTFAYAVFFQFTDEFGNSYGPICSNRLVRYVHVPPLKRHAGFAAMAAVANAVIFAAAAAAAFLGIITAPAGALLAAIATGWYVAAAGAGAIAHDPPAPDPDFREPATVVPLPLPSVGGEPALPATWSMLQTSARLLGLENARTSTRARLMGARLFGDEDAVERQRQVYLSIEREMLETADRLNTSLADVQLEVETNPYLDPRSAAAWFDAIAQEGIPPNLRDAMASAGLSDEQINGLAVLFRFQNLVELSKANGVFLVPFVGHLRRFVEAIRAEREAIFAGETYVAVNRVVGTGLEEQDHDGAEARPRRTRQCC